MHVARTLMIIF